MLSRYILEKLTFIDLILLILSMSFTLFADQMKTSTSDTENTLEIGLFYNRSKKNSNVTQNQANQNWSYTINYTYFDFESLNIESYKGNLKSLL